MSNTKKAFIAWLIGSAIYWIIVGTVDAYDPMILNHCPDEPLDLDGNSGCPTFWGNVVLLFAFPAIIGGLFDAALLLGGVLALGYLAAEKLGIVKPEQPKA